MGSTGQAGVYPQREKYAGLRYLDSGRALYGGRRLVRGGSAGSSSGLPFDFSRRYRPASLCRPRKRIRGSYRFGAAASGTADRDFPPVHAKPDRHQRSSDRPGTDAGAWEKGRRLFLFAEPGSRFYPGYHRGFMPAPAAGLLRLFSGV